MPLQMGLLNHLRRELGYRSVDFGQPRSNRKTSRWDGGAAHIPYIVRFPLKADQVFDVDDGHDEKSSGCSYPESKIQFKAPSKLLV